METWREAAIAHAFRLMVGMMEGRAIVWNERVLQPGDHSKAQPDLAVLKPRSDSYALRQPESQDLLLIVDFLESSSEHRPQLNARLYAEAGIPEYWICNLSNESLLVHTHPDQKTYRLMRELQRGECVSPRLLPDLKIPIHLLALSQGERAARSAGRG